MGTAVGCVKGVVLEETIEGVSVVFEFGLTVDVGVKDGVTTLVVIVEMTVDITVCVVCFEAVVSDVENSVGGCDTVEVAVGVTVLVDVESGWLVVKSVVIGGIVEVTPDADALDLVDCVGPVVVTPEFDTDDTVVAIGVTGDAEVVNETLREDEVCTAVPVVSVF